MLDCSHPCSVVAASAEPQRAAVVLRLANLDVVNQPLPVRAAGRRSSTSERSRLSRHHAASRAVAARPNQAAVHLPPRHVLQLVVLSAERTVEHVLLLADLAVQTVPLHVQATVLRHVHRKRAAVLLRVHRPVLQLADQRVQTAPHHVRRSVLLLAELTVQPVLLPADLLARAVLLRVHLHAVQRVQTAPHHVRRSVLQLADLTVQTAPHHVPVLVALSADQAVLQPAVPRAPAAATIVAVQTLAKSLS